MFFLVNYVNLVFPTFVCVCITKLFCFSGWNAGCEGEPLCDPGKRFRKGLQEQCQERRTRARVL